MNAFINIFEQINIMFLNSGEDFVSAMFNATKTIYNVPFWTAILICYFMYIAFKFFKMEVDIKQILNFIFFLLAVVVVFVFTRNEVMFYLFVDLIKIPSEILEELVLKMLNSVVKDPIAIIGDLQIAFSQIGKRISIDSTVLHYIVLFFYYGLSIALITMVILATLVSSFMSMFTLGLGIILTPCIFFKITSSMFFNWLRTYLFFSTLPPTSMLMMTFILQIINFIQNTNFSVLNIHEVSTILVAEVIGILGLWLLVALLNQIIGTQNPTSALGGGIIGGIIGASSALGITKLSKKLATSAVNKTFSYSKQIGSGIAGMTKQAVSNALNRNDHSSHSNPSIPDSKSQ